MDQRRLCSGPRASLPRLPITLKAQWQLRNPYQTGALAEQMSQHR
jgi:hypothetical protein